MMNNESIGSISVKYVAKNDASKHLAQVVICERHLYTIKPDYNADELYYGSEECIVCEVNQ